jgi:dihydrodipicolinate synthase/N-acetylneuraminate lyase
LPVILANMTADHHMLPLPEGLLVELATPLTPTGYLDKASLARLLNQVAPSAAALVAGSPGVGEALELPRAVRLELFTTLVEDLPPNLPLFFGITEATPEDTQSLAGQLEDELRRQPTTRPVFWVDLPLWWHSNRGLPQTYFDLCRHLSRPLVLMNHPHLIRGKARPLKHVNIRTAIFKKLTAIPGVAALIYQGEMRRFLHYYSAMAARPEFVLYEADERRFLTRPGARGLVSAGAQLFPGVWRQVAQACLFPEQLDGLGSRRGLIWEWSDILLRVQELYQLNPAPLLKLGLHHQGVIEYPAIWPSTPSCPAHLGERFLELLDSVKDTLTSG